MLESEMMDISYTYLSEQKDFIAVKQEVPFLSRCIDIVLLNNTNEVISIELKVHDWRHAIEQAVNHKLGADKSYICLPKRKLSKDLTSALQAAGIGLFFFEKDEKKPIYEVLAATRNNGNVPAFKKILIANMNRV